MGDNASGMHRWIHVSLSRSQGDLNMRANLYLIFFLQEMKKNCVLTGWGCVNLAVVIIKDFTHACFRLVWCVILLFFSVFFFFSISVLFFLLQPHCEHIISFWMAVFSAAAHILARNSFSSTNFYLNCRKFVSFRTLKPLCLNWYHM